MRTDQIGLDRDVPEQIGVDVVGHDLDVLVVTVAGLEEEGEAVDGHRRIGFENATLPQRTRDAVFRPRRRAEVGEDCESEQDYETEDQFAHAHHCVGRAVGRAAPVRSEAVHGILVLTWR